MRPIAVLLLALGVATVAAVPVGSQSRDQRQLMADVRMLHEQAQQIQVNLTALTDAVKALAERLDAQEAASRRGFADQKLVVDGLTGDLRALREQVAQTNARLTTIDQEVDGLREEMRRAPAPAPAPAPAEGQPAVAAPPAPAGPAPTGTTPRQLFQNAYGDFSAGQYALAIQTFEAYVSAYPSSDQADDAVYYMGEAYAGDKRFTEAIAAYRRLIRDYPNSDVLADAHYKIGVNYLALGEADRAREAFELTVKRFGGTAAAQRARDELARR